MHLCNVVRGQEVFAAVIACEVVGYEAVYCKRHLPGGSPVSHIDANSSANLRTEGLLGRYKKPEGLGCMQYLPHFEELLLQSFCAGERDVRQVRGSAEQAEVGQRCDG